jgi:hypothetical protein
LNAAAVGVRCASDDRALLSHPAGRHAAEESGKGVRLHTQGQEERGTPHVRDGCVRLARVANADSHTYGSQAEEAPMCIVEDARGRTTAGEVEGKGRTGRWFHTSHIRA